MSQEFYQQPHVFVVFRPGSAGNLISTIVYNLINNSTTELKMSSSGDAHENNIVKRKRNNADHFSLGSGILDTDIKFLSVEEKLTYYKHLIDLHPYESRPYVTWTHDFTNIDLYRVLFPNCKIIEITNDSVYETQVGLLFHVNKNIFDPASQSPLSDLDQIFVKIIKKNMILQSFRRLYQGKKYQEGLPDLDLHLLCSYNLNILDYFQKLDHKQKMSWLERKTLHLFVRPPASDADHKIQLIDILQGTEEGIANITDVFAKILNRDLHSSELDYVQSTLINYISSQNPLILQNPNEYIRGVEEKANRIVSAF